MVFTRTVQNNSGMPVAGFTPQRLANDIENIFGDRFEVTLAPLLAATVLRSGFFWRGVVFLGVFATVVGIGLRQHFSRTRAVEDGATRPDRPTEPADRVAQQMEDSAVILIGEFGSLTGSEATFGTSTRDGIALAIEEVNAAGGVNGKKLEVIGYDDQGKQEEAATAVTRLITYDKVKAILGEVASSRSMAGAPIAQRYRVPMISPSSTNPKVTQVGDYIFRACFIDPVQGTVMARFARNTLKLQRVAVFRDIHNDYSVGLSDYFRDEFTRLGGTIVDDQAYTAGDPDFKSQLTVMKGQRPEAIYVPGYYTDVALIAKQARELGIKVPFLGGDGWDSPTLTEIGGTAIEGSYFTNHVDEGDPRPEQKVFANAYHQRYGEKPDALAALAYDAAKLLVDAMRRAKSLDGPDLRDAIAATKDLKGATGPITLDKDRNPAKPAVVLKVEGGRWKYVETIQP